MRQGVEELASMFKELESVIVNMFDKVTEEFERKNRAEEEFLSFY